MSDSADGPARPFVEHTPVAHPESAATLQQCLGHLFVRADQHEWRIEQALCGNASEISGQFGGGGFPVIGVHDELNQGVEFDRVEPVACGVAHHRDPLLETCRIEVGQPDFGGVPVVREAGQPDDVGHPAGQLQHPGSVATDQQRHRLGGRSDQRTRVGMDPVVVAVEVHGLAAEQRAYHPTDSTSRRPACHPSRTGCRRRRTRTSCARPRGPTRTGRRSPRRGSPSRGPPRRDVEGRC